MNVQGLITLKLSQHTYAQFRQRRVSAPEPRDGSISTIDVFVSLEYSSMAGDDEAV